MKAGDKLTMLLLLKILNKKSEERKLGGKLVWKKGCFFFHIFN
jgi:hypothetical protein